MNDFIWQSNKTRLSFSLMTRYPSLGGMGLPNLQAYHFAVTLDKVKFWWHNSPENHWPQIEASLLKIMDWKSALLDPVASSKQVNHLSPPKKLRYNIGDTCYLAQAPP